MSAVEALPASRWMRRIRRTMARLQKQGRGFGTPRDSVSAGDGDQDERPRGCALRRLRPPRTGRVRPGRPSRRPSRSGGAPPCGPDRCRLRAYPSPTPRPPRRRPRPRRGAGSRTNRLARPAVRPASSPRPRAKRTIGWRKRRTRASHASRFSKSCRPSRIVDVVTHSMGEVARILTAARGDRHVRIRAGAFGNPRPRPTRW